MHSLADHSQYSTGYIHALEPSYGLQLSGRGLREPEFAPDPEGRAVFRVTHHGLRWASMAHRTGSPTGQGMGSPWLRAEPARYTQESWRGGDRNEGDPSGGLRVQGFTLGGSVRASNPVGVLSLYGIYRVQC